MTAKHQEVFLQGALDLTAPGAGEPMDVFYRYAKNDPSMYDEVGKIIYDWVPVFLTQGQGRLDMDMKSEAATYLYYTTREEDEVEEKGQQLDALVYAQVWDQLHGLHVYVDSGVIDVGEVCDHDYEHLYFIHASDVLLQAPLRV